MNIKKLVFFIMGFVFLLTPFIDSKGINPEDVDKMEIIYALKGIMYNYDEETGFLFGVIKFTKPDQSNTYSFFLDIENISMLDYKGEFGYYCIQKNIDGEYLSQSDLKHTSEKITLECDEDENGIAFFKEGVWKFRQIKGFVYGTKYNPYLSADAEVNFEFTKEGNLNIEKSSILIPDQQNKLKDSSSINCEKTTILSKNKELIDVVDPNGNPVVYCESNCYIYDSTQKIKIDGKEYDDTIYDKNTGCKESKIRILEEIPFSTTYLNFI